MLRDACTVPCNVEGKQTCPQQLTTKKMHIILFVEPVDLKNQFTKTRAHQSCLVGEFLIAQCEAKQALGSLLRPRCEKQLKLVAKEMEFCLHGTT